jgi:UTP--glucose-1-phosphate uridylyltransferase
VEFQTDQYSLLNESGQLLLLYYNVTETNYCFISMPSVSKAIIPAAGLGKRMHPLSSYMSKPMLPLGRKPVLQHIIEEIRAAGVEEILILSRSEHKAIRSYFQDRSNITIEIDDSAGGPGEAILKGERFAGNGSLLSVFSDAPLGGEEPEVVIKKMKELFQQHDAEAVLSIYPVPEKEAGSRGIVKVDDLNSRRGLYRITDIIEKPGSISISEPMASACRYLFTSRIFSALKSANRDKNGELQLTAGIKELIKGGHKVLGITLPEGITRHDTGNFKGYFRALNSFNPAAE